MAERGERTIVAMGGGGFSMEPENPLLDDYVLGLSGRARPRVCFVATASGDRPEYIGRFLAAFPAGRAQTSILRLFACGSEASDPRMLLEQDVIYVGGGNTASILAVWRARGVDRAMREAWEAGIVLTGVSAGMICWFEGCVTDSFGPLAALRDGLGLLGGSACPHYDGEAQRRPTYHRLVAAGVDAGLASGVAADDGAALVFRGGEVRECVASRAGAGAYSVGLEGGRVVERRLETRFLGA